VLSGKGKVLLYPYNTPVGTINVVFCTRPELCAKQPDYVRDVVKAHVATMKFAANPANLNEFEAMITKALGPTKPTLDMAMKNIAFDWNIDADYIAKAKYYGTQMIALKEITALPDYSTFINTSFLPK
jgi:NitT/TauT family transport system substrate-binding protein